MTDQKSKAQLRRERQWKRKLADLENVVSICRGDVLRALNCGHFAPTLEDRERRLRDAETELSRFRETKP